PPEAGIRKATAGTARTAAWLAESVPTAAAPSRPVLAQPARHRERNTSLMDMCRRALNLGRGGGWTKWQDGRSAAGSDSIEPDPAASALGVSHQNGGFRLRIQ